jgi:phosphopantothenoylcysteine decarboxylase/phosphopantothenate--cysteine ligase
MSEPGDIARAAFALLTPQALTGKKFLISAGGTREPLDPVRFLGNRSTGAMGVAIASSAKRQGADVTLVAANLEVAEPHGVNVVHANTVSALREAMLTHQKDADVVVMAAAVADWVPVSASAQKLSKEDLGDRFAPEFSRAPDVLEELVHHKPASQIVVGFAAETSEDVSERETRARKKLASKGVDWLVLNQVGNRVGFGEVETAVTIFSTASPQSLSVEGTKDSIADRLLEVLLDR